MFRCISASKLLGSQRFRRRPTNISDDAPLAGVGLFQQFSEHCQCRGDSYGLHATTLDPEGSLFQSDSASRLAGWPPECCTGKLMAFAGTVRRTIQHEASRFLVRLKAACPPAELGLTSPRADRSLHRVRGGQESPRSRGPEQLRAIKKPRARRGLLRKPRNAAQLLSRLWFWGQRRLPYSIQGNLIIGRLNASS